MDNIYTKGNWGDNELRLYLAQNAIERKLEWERWQAERPAQEQQPVSLGTLANRVAEIMSAHPHLTEANRRQVEQLAAHERAFSVATMKFQQAVEDGNVKDMRQYQQTMTGLTAEIRQLMRSLRIDVGSLQGEGPEELRQEILEMMDQAKAMLQQHAIRLVCPACTIRKEGPAHINLGFLLFHFRDDVPWHLWLTCPHPKCGQGIHIVGGPGRETLIYNGPEHIGPPKT